MLRFIEAPTETCSTKQLFHICSQKFCGGVIYSKVAGWRPATLLKKTPSKILFTVFFIRSTDSILCRITFCRTPNFVEHSSKAASVLVNFELLRKRRQVFLMFLVRHLITFICFLLEFFESTQLYLEVLYEKLN